MSEVEVLRGKWRITERRDGCVFKTEYVGNEWVPMDSPAGKMHTVGDVQWTSPTCSPDEQTIRRARKEVLITGEEKAADPGDRGTLASQADNKFTTQQPLCTTSGEDMPGKTSSRKPRTARQANALAELEAMADRLAPQVPTQAEANAVADTIADAASKMAAMKAEYDALPAPVVIDRAVAKAAKVKAACEADYRVQAVQAHAEANYETGGWDTVLEAMEAVDIYWVVYKSRSSAGAIRAMDAHLAPYASHRDEIVNA